MPMNLKTLKDAMKRVNEDAAFRRRGTCDAVMGIKSGSKCYAVTFEAFEVSGVREIDQDGLVDVDFYIDMKKKDWDEFLAGLKSGKAPGLNELDLEQRVVKGEDEGRRLAFLRYHSTFQHFFEAAA